VGCLFGATDCVFSTGLCEQHRTESGCRPLTVEAKLKWGHGADVGCVSAFRRSFAKSQYLGYHFHAPSVDELMTVSTSDCRLLSQRSRQFVAALCSASCASGTSVE
jgi:hypothetical protein